MPTIEILGPFSGRPVKVRPEDVGKAVRDEENRIFYVLQRPDGSGYYSAPSRAGGERDIARYDKYLERTSGAKKATKEAEVQHTRAAKKRSDIGKLVKMLIVVALLAALAWYAYTKGWVPGFKPTQPASPPAQNQ